MNLLPVIAQAGIVWSPIALGIAIAVILLAVLVLRFIVKTALTLVKIAIVVIIGAGAYLAFQTFL